MSTRPHLPPAAPSRVRDLLAGPGALVASIVTLTALAGCFLVDGGSPAGSPPSSRTESAVPGPAAAPGSPDGPVDYRLGVVRDRNVVVVVESRNWIDRTELTLELAVHRAVPGGRGRCGRAVLPCPHPAAEAGGTAYDLSPDPLLTEGDWAQVAGGGPSPVRSPTRPTRLVECISVTPWSGATDFRLSAYLDPERPLGDLTEFVLRFEDAASAAEAVRRIRNQFDDCPRRTAFGDAEVTEHEHHASDGPSWWPVDEAFIGTRAYPGRSVAEG
jgi:hypothetical protein